MVKRGVELIQQAPQLAPVSSGECVLPLHQDSSQHDAGFPQEFGIQAGCLTTGACDGNREGVQMMTAQDALQSK